MRKFVLFFSVAMLMLVMGACVSTKRTVAKNAQLSEYDFVSVVNEDGRKLPTDFSDHEILFYDAIEASGKKLVNERRLYELTPQQKEKLLLVGYEVVENGKTPQIVLTFTDYGTGRPVVSCKTDIDGGLLDFSRDAKVRSTMKRLGQEVYKSFHPAQR